jgi:hypothetical protein
MFYIDLSMYYFDNDDDDDDVDTMLVQCWYHLGTMLVPCMCIYIYTNNEPISGKHIKHIKNN